MEVVGGGVYEVGVGVYEIIRKLGVHTIVQDAASVLVTNRGYLDLSFPDLLRHGTQGLTTLTP